MNDYIQIIRDSIDDMHREYLDDPTTTKQERAKLIQLMQHLTNVVSEIINSQ